MWGRRWRRWIPLFAALPLAGCGDSTSQDQIRATLTRFMSAVTSHNAPAACAAITNQYWEAFRAELQMRVGAQRLPAQARTCAGSMAYVFRLAGRPTRHPHVSVTNVAVHGASASANVMVAGATQGSIQFARVGGSWRISCCVGSQVSQQRTTTYRVPSGSMEPTLHVGQIITSDNAAMRAHPPSVGDIVTFHPPAGADPANAQCGDRHQGTGFKQACDRPTPAESAETFIKRVVAGPGDRISIVNGHVIRNGTREPDAYANACGSGPDCNFPAPIVIPAGEYFVLGDNRGLSDDSRFWGPVKRAWIIGLVKR